MKTYLLILALFFSLTSYSQDANIIEKSFNEMKRNTKVDNTDSTCFKLMQKMYDEVLQNNNSGFTKLTINEIKKYQSAKKSKNTYLFSALMFYQEVIGKSLELNSVNPALQRDVVNYLEKESISLYNKIPNIVYVYKVETLNLLNDKTELKKYIDEGLKHYPNSIPLKYYSYVFLKDETYKEELLKLNKVHWLVQM